MPAKLLVGYSVASLFSTACAEGILMPGSFWGGIVMISLGVLVRETVVSCGRVILGQQKILDESHENSWN